MSVVDAPPGFDFSGPAQGEFVARKGPRRLSRVVFAICLLDGIITVLLASRKLYSPGTSLLFIGPLVCCSIASVGLAVRSARVRIEQSGVFWGWGNLGIRVGKSQIQSLIQYRGALAIFSSRGSVWYLSKQDWDRFTEISSALVDAGYTLETRDRRAPIRAQIQAYGYVLDGLLILVLLGSAALLLFAALR